MKLFREARIPQILEIPLNRTVMVKLRNFIIAWGHLIRRHLLVRETVLVLGDSHARAFEHWWFAIRFPRVLLRVFAVSGATASGLENPNSKTQAYRKFREAMRVPGYRKVIVMLGEVDTGFVIWYRASKHGGDVSTMFGQAVARYSSFLTMVKRYAETIVVSTPLPTIEDGNTWGEIANLRKEVTATQQERTDLTLRFNKCVAQHCRREGITFIDLDEACLGENGLVKDGFKNRNRYDHHYNRLPYVKLLARRLSGLI